MATPLPLSGFHPALQTTLYLHQECSAMSQKVGDLIESLSLEVKEKLLAERKATELEAERVKQVDFLKSELEEERQKVKDLMEQVQNVSMEVTVRTRGELMLEYKRGEQIGWDIELFRSYYPLAGVGGDGYPAKHERNSIT